VYCLGGVLDLPPWAAALMNATNPSRRNVKPPSAAILKAKYSEKDQARIVATYEADWWNSVGAQGENEVQLLEAHSDQEERAFWKWIVAMGEVFSDLDHLSSIDLIDTFLLLATW